MFKSKSAFLNALKTLPNANQDYIEKARARQKILTKPEGSLGRLEDLACWLAGWQHSATPLAKNVNVTIFAGNHGITAQNISPFPPTVTAQMVENFSNGGAAINQICKTFDLNLTVKSLDLDQPTGDITCSNALSTEECLAAINIGASCVNVNDHIIVPGEMGIGNSTVASILSAKILGGTGKHWAGAGTGLKADGIEHKAQVIDRALAYHGAEINDPFDLLCQLGGREFAAIVGFIIAARVNSIPVILDGFIATTAAATLTLNNLNTLDHCVAGHLSNEQAHSVLLKKIGLFPALLDLDMRLGEATGAALAVQILRSAVSTHNGMASFEEAGISNT